MTKNEEKKAKKTNEKRAKEAHESPYGEDAFFVELESFSGPLDLLLHLIKEHEMDIFDIPIAIITEKYLAYVELMQEMNLDNIGDFLVMAATLAHIKSKMLLPPGEEDEQEDGEPEDPREELVRRLLEYQKYKSAAESLQKQPILGRDTFTPPADYSVYKTDDETPIEEVNIFELIEIFQEILNRAKSTQMNVHQVQLDSFKVEDKIREVLAKLRDKTRVTFRSLFANIFTRPELVATFLGILEIARLGVVHLFQTPGGGEIYLSKRAEAPDDETVMRRVTLDKETDAAGVDLATTEELPND